MSINLDYIQTKYRMWLETYGYLPIGFCAYDRPVGTEHIEIVPTLTTNCGTSGGSNQLYIAVSGEGQLLSDKLDLPCIVASRGRNPENPSSRKTGIDTEQQLEINSDGTSNCLTSVAKDNWVLEPVVLTKERTELGKQSRKSYERKEVSLKRSEVSEHTPRKDGCSGTITTVQKDNYLVEPNAEPQIHYVGSIGDTDRIGDGKNLSRNSRTGDRVYAIDGIATTISAEGGGVGGHSGLYTVDDVAVNDSQLGVKTMKEKLCKDLNASAKHQQDLVQSEDDISRTLVAGSHLNSDTYTKTMVEAEEHKYPFRIRKLTPKECWRLQGFDDEDIDKCITDGVSSSQLYKQAGNSIAVNCLEAIFANLLGIERDIEIDDDSEMRLF